MVVIISIFGITVLNPRATENGFSFKQIIVPFPEDKGVTWNYDSNKVLKCVVTLPSVEFGFRVHEIYPPTVSFQSASFQLAL